MHRARAHFYCLQPAAPPASGALLLEDGSFLLLEDGSKLLLG